ncbi:hypothetical protein LF845_07085 [Deferribacterales bacterium Es71-Z0220]|jgi:hypothetical protein|uniref:hypothetical protein n=1 Tax=Deferrivibrio essentukiensis TaxID=2880922 RepID=UPI001F6110D9|nr:hypothetical protein [Deferrivibrio essentukiensis]MCB4204723.1 hypothetical protein [Deferrivibrio essentukiensis]
MKLKDINRYIFINPSPNMLKVAKKIEEFGKKTEICVDKDIMAANCYKLSVHFDNEFLFYSDKNRESEFLEKNAFKFKRGLFYRHPVIENIPFKGTSKELYLINKGKILFEQKNDFNIFNGKPNDDEVVIFSYSKNMLSERDCKRKIVTILEVDKETSNALHFNYFIFFIKDLKYEMFLNGNKLYVVGDKDADILFSKRLEFFKKNNFKKLSEFAIYVNENPYLVKSEKNYILLNDYSYFNISVKMPEEWYHKLGRYLCTGKQ